MTGPDHETPPTPNRRERELAPRIARFWWIGAVRGAIALMLGAVVLLAQGSPGRLPTFLALYWLAGGVVTLRFAVALRPDRGFRLATFAGAVAIVAAMLVLLRELLSEVVSAEDLVDVLGLAAVAMGALRLIGAFELERRTGRRWTIGGLVLGGLELGTGLLLIATESRSRGVMITVGAWSLASGTLLIVQAFRARRLARALSPPSAATSNGP
jgi:uncharacterized membrane protein HdeD (DUF308 family)